MRPRRDGRLATGPSHTVGAVVARAQRRARGTTNGRLAEQGHTLGHRPLCYRHRALVHRERQRMSSTSPCTPEGERLACCQPLVENHTRLPRVRPGSAGGKPRDNEQEQVHAQPRRNRASLAGNSQLGFSGQQVARSRPCSHGRSILRLISLYPRHGHERFDRLKALNHEIRSIWVKVIPGLAELANKSFSREVWGSSWLTGSNTPWSPTHEGASHVATQFPWTARQLRASKVGLLCVVKYLASVKPTQSKRAHSVLVSISNPMSPGDPRTRFTTFCFVCAACKSPRG